MRWLDSWLFVRLSLFQRKWMNAIYLSKQQALDADPRSIQQINFTANIDRAGSTTIFFIIEEAKETILDCKSLIEWFNFYQYKMAKYNSLNVKLSSSWLNELKSAIKDKTDVVLRLSSNIIGNSDYKINIPHELLSPNRQVANLRTVFANWY